MDEPARATIRRRGRVLRAVALGAVAATVFAGASGAATVRLPPGHQVNDDPGAGIDPARSVSGEAPNNSDVAGGTLTAGAGAVPWSIFRQMTAGSDQIFSRSFAAGAWTTRGGGTVGGRSSATPTFPGSLNFDQGASGEAPAIDFAGAGRAVPWATWYETTTGTGFNAENIFASRFDSVSGDWLFAGQSRGLGGGTVPIPSLNIHTDANAENPSVAGGATTAGNNPGPWITWQEVDGTDQIFVVKPIGPGSLTCPGGTKPAGGPAVDGGFCWQQVGTERVNNADPSLNVDRTRNGIEPDIAFTGSNDTVPWVVWYENGNSAAGLHDNELVFAAKGVVDNAADGNFHWQVVGSGTAGEAEALDNSSSGGPCGANAVAEAACSLNNDPFSSAEDPRVAAGTMTAGTPTVPWVTWTEAVNGRDQIFVARLVGGDHFELANGGKPISISTNNSTRPDITFAGNTPYVTWRENTGTNVDKAFVGHFVNATNPTFVLDNGPIAITPAAVADLRVPISSGCTANPVNSDGASCQGGLLGTPFFLFTQGLTPRKLFGDAYQPGVPATRGATDIGRTKATLHATVNPEGTKVLVRFDFGRTTSYGKHTAFQVIQPANALRTFRATVSGQPVNTRFHYRAEVRTDFGVLFGGDRVFTTLHAR
jgi:hypothetical protein